MRPLDFYELGRELAGSAATEAECRNVIGRLYYGLHHEAGCRYFREYPGALPLGRGRRHSQLIQGYRSLHSSEARQVRRLLRQLSNMRNISDYELAEVIQYERRARTASQLMSMAMTVAEELLAELESFSPGAGVRGLLLPHHPIASVPLMLR